MISFYKSIVDQDRASIVICNLKHEIIYMNPAAVNSHNLVYTFHNEKQNKDVYMVALREEGRLIGYYEKHEYRNAETMKQYDLW